MKMNSVTDVDFIEQISRASRAGVEVDLLVRGICCIRAWCAKGIRITCV